MNGTLELILLPVADVDRAKKFYVERPGRQLVAAAGTRIRRLTGYMLQTISRGDPGPHTTAALKSWARPPRASLPATLTIPRAGS